MIKMPVRSVTRFFIPLIDVLLLLFVIFLLMPLKNEDDILKSQEKAQNLSEDVEALERELQQLREELALYRDLKPSLIELQSLREEVDRMKAAAKKSLQERAAVQVIDIDGKTGEIYFYDAGKDPPRIPLPNEVAVVALIDRHKKENPGRDLYYLFAYPRPETTYPTRLQVRDYSRWFASVANSLKDR